MSDEYLTQLKALERRLSHLERLEEQGMSRGWIGGAWQKNPIALGYSGDKTEEVSDTSASAGSNNLASTSVPAGEIWIIQAIIARDVDNAPTKIRLNVTVNSTGVVLKTETSPVTGIWVSWTGEVVLSEGDQVTVNFEGVTLNDDIYMRYHGVRVDIDQ